MLMLHAYLLGGLALTAGDPLPPVHSRTAHSLLAYLLTHRDRPHTRDLLAGTFWPDLPDATARRRLTQALWQIRTALFPHPVLLTEGDTVQLNPEMPLWIDVAEFEQQAGSTASLQAAVDLYRGEFLAGYYDDWTIAERERLHDIFLDTLGRLTEVYKAHGDHERALGCARRLAAEDPWREEAHCEVMRLCHLLGRDAEALKQYEMCCQVLADDLGAEPSAETAALAAEIAARAGLAGPPLLPSAARPVLAPLLERPDRLPLVGRQAELAGLLGQVEAAIAGHGGLTIIYGEAGVGKSRLLHELAGNARWRGVQTAWGYCHEMAAPAAYQPFFEVLRACLPILSSSRLAPVWRACLAPLLPELAGDASPLPPVPPDQERHRLLEAIVQALVALAETAPHLILLDDTHWIDPASLEVLRHLLPRVADSRLLVAITVRGEELAGQTAAELWAMEDTRLPRRLELRRLDAAATGELVQRALGLEQPAPHFSARLYAETEGNPFFVVEALRTLVEEGLLVRDQAGVWSTPWDDSTQDYAELPLPAEVAHSIERRLARLPDPLDQALDLAAAIGRSLDFRLWLSASGWEEGQLLAAADELCARGLLMAATAGADYVFAHDLIRRVAYERLAAPRRRFYHRRVAEALARLAPAEPAPLAFHWTRAEVWDRAADYHRQAGDRARTMYAHAEAVDHYGQALRALERMPGSPDPARAFELRLAREAAYAWLGERAAQAQELAALAALSRDLDARKQAEVALRQATYATATGDYQAAIAAAREAIAAGASLQPSSAHEAMAYLRWGQALWHQGAYAPARSQIQHALELAEEAQLGPIVADSRLSLGRVFLAQGDYAQARTDFGQALDFYRQAGDLRGQAEALENLGSASHMQGDYPQARSDFEQALRVFGQIGDRQGESRALHRLGSLSVNQGEHAVAESYLERAIQIACEIGDRGMQSSLLAALGALANRRCEYSTARTHLERALQIYREIGDRRGEEIALTNLGIVLYCLGDLEQATAYAEQAQQIGLEIGDRRFQGWALHTLGRIAAQQGRYTQAKSCYEQGRQISQVLGDQQLETVLLNSLSLLAHQMGDNGAALEHARQALRIVEAIGEPVDTGYALTSLGHALAGLGRLDEADAAYRQALEVRRSLGQHNLAAESQAGLARVALAKGEIAEAQARADEILAYLQTRTLDGTEEPLRVYLTCYQVLHAAHDPRGEAILPTAYSLLQERASKAGDPSFLDRSAAHRQIMAAYREHQLARQIEVRLPRADAPLGRPLRDDEQVTVTWTVVAAEDEAVADKAARRRQRLLRLLCEAQAQGAVPAHQHLAQALAVSQRTIERDLALLRDQQELLPPTRGEMSDQSEPAHT
jgi:DNA-binding SARP family transcriptional activator/Flp pilus assembly protein TadD